MTTRRTRTSWRKAAVAAGLAAVTMLATACSGPSGTGSAPAAGSTATTDVTISVAWVGADAPPQAALDDFTKQTGIKVTWADYDWDSMQTKISAAAAANTYFADVTNVDWTRIGQYSKLGWFLPLENYLDANELKADMPQLSSFIADGHIIGLPTDASYMVTTVNTDMFTKAGITTMPTTIDQYVSDLQTIKSKGIVDYPLDIPFAAAEGLSTYWYTVTNAFGGTVLDETGKPLFTDPNSPGHKAAQWMIDAIKKNGLVPPGNVNVNDGQGIQTLMAQGQVASIMSDYAGLVGTLYDAPEGSTVVGQIKYIPTPGLTGTVPNLSCPDGIGIPKQAKYPEAAAKFIDWVTSTDKQADFVGLNGADKVWAGAQIPSRMSAVQKMAAAGDIGDGDTLVTLLKGSVPVFPKGVPAWYPTFSNAVYTNLNAAASGTKSLDDALAAIADVANQQSSGS